MSETPTELRRVAVREFDRFRKKTIYTMLYVLAPLAASMPFLSLACADTGIPKSAPNCSLAAPPEGSGENGNHGIYFFVYPREVAPDYTGCQIMWADDGKKWMILYLERGNPRILQFDVPSDPKGKKVCNYENGNLLNKKEDSCPEYEHDKPFGNLLIESLPPGRIPGALDKLREVQKKLSLYPEKN